MSKGTQDQPEDGHPAWRVKVDDTVYGPYSLEQMRKYVTEGRVAAHTLISAKKTALFKPAIEYELFAKDVQSIEASKHDSETNAANYIIFADIADQTTQPVIAVLNSIGRFAEATTNVYILRSALRIARVRAALEKICGPEDRVVVVDASRNRLAWLGLGHETDIHIRSVWNAEVD